MAAIALFSVAHENGQMSIGSQILKTYTMFPGTIVNSKKNQFGKK